MARHKHIPAIYRGGWRTQCGWRPTRQARRLGGFTFTEVLFAVVILGIGFIMLAAMFPVALSQTKLTVNESAGVQAATGASAAMNSVFDGSDWSLSSVSLPNGGGSLNESLPQTVNPSIVLATGQSFVPGEALPIGTPSGNPPANPIAPLPPLAPNAINLSQIVPSDPRYAWSVLYRRDLVASYMNASGTAFVASPYAQLICIPVVTGVTGQFVSTDVPSGTFNSSTYLSASIRPQFVTGSINFDVNSNTYYFEAPSATTLQNAPYGPGSYLVVNDDNNTGSFRGLLNGNVYRLGSLIPAPGLDTSNPNTLQFYFAPGWDFKPQVVYSPVPGGGSTTIDASNGTVPGAIYLGSVNFYVVGRYLQNGVYSGNSQEVGAFVTTVKVQ
jgi:type II secretory pathway pseudopilin PulG